MKKIRLSIIALLAMLLCFAFVACEPVDSGSSDPGSSDPGSSNPPVVEVLPEVIITSEAATITTMDSYTLVYEVKNADSEEVTVSEKDGITTGAYDAETKIFTASEAGEYTLTVTAVKGEDIASASVIVTVIEYVDEVAPVITIDGDKEYTVAAGGDIVLPSATANDNIDGDISDELYIYCESGNAFSKLENGVFSSLVAGVHEVVYYSEDLAGNYASEIVKINVTPAAEENWSVEGFNDISVLANGGTFKENFEKGGNSPLIMDRMPQTFTMTADERAIAGNSIVIDYEELKGTQNQTFLECLMPYMSSGEWEISFDVKLLRGVGAPDFYFGYGYNGGATTDQNYNLSGLAVGDVYRVVWKNTLLLAEGNVYWFHMFKLDQNNYTDCLLAIDNFEVKLVKYNTLRVAPTMDAISAEGGLTYDWANKNTSISGGTMLQVATLGHAGAKEAIENAATGFTDWVLYVNAGHIVFNDFHKVLDAGKYVLDIDYYAINVASNCCFIVDPGNQQVIYDVFEAGLGHATIEFEVSADLGFDDMYFYNSFDGLFGNITIKKVA